MLSAPAGSCPSIRLASMVSNVHLVEDFSPITDECCDCSTGSAGSNARTNLWIFQLLFVATPYTLPCSATHRPYRCPAAPAWSVNLVFWLHHTVPLEKS